MCPQQWHRPISHSVPITSRKHPFLHTQFSKSQRLCGCCSSWYSGYSSHEAGSSGIKNTQHQRGVPKLFFLITNRASKKFTSTQSLLLHTHSVVECISLTAGEPNNWYAVLRINVLMAYNTSNTLLLQLHQCIKDVLLEWPNVMHNMTWGQTD